jgi:hypothetical protein
MRREWLSKMVVRDNRSRHHHHARSRKRHRLLRPPPPSSPSAACWRSSAPPTRCWSLRRDALRVSTSRVLWDLKVIGLAVVFVYAFFKFAWATACSTTRRSWSGPCRAGQASEAEEQAAAVRAARMTSWRGATSTGASGVLLSRWPISAGSWGPRLPGGHRRGALRDVAEAVRVGRAGGAPGGRAHPMTDPRRSPSPEAVEASLLRFAAERGPDKTFSPADVPGTWGHPDGGAPS